MITTEVEKQASFQIRSLWHYGRIRDDRGVWCRGGESTGRVAVLTVAGHDVGMSKRLLPPIPAGLIVDDVRLDAERLTILTHPRAADATCPTCGRSSARLHSRYTRILPDLPWQGRRVAITVQSRRWRCANQTCPRRIFAERLPTVAPPRARRTRRLGELQRHLALALGGEGGGRLAGRLGVPVSGDTLLRVLRRDSPVTPASAPRVLGVDDWAWRRGQRYGTILVDLER